eukprot:TRINITY_DN49609_c0_g1_i2.p1 TRINITY_DN49609_c0_g1~~TRINITY_DN49609_c0_g1_i2.p1  ORF type:complete len:405 (+),score=113.39 TRINITY_DN49609_c0_g1_i2:76-1290(+)
MASSLLRTSATVARSMNASRGYAAAAGELRKTPLYDLNVELGGKMVEFGGWSMPVTYGGKEGGILPTHMHTREAAGMFDVSHMVPVRFYGKDRAKFMESFLVGDIQEIPENMGQLSSIPNEQGGLIDDCIVTNAGDHMYLVINAGHEDKDLPHIEALMADFKGKGGDVSMEVATGGGLIALQGPKAVDVMSRLCPDFDFGPMPFMGASWIDVAGTKCFVTRSGYTGEDGFEIGVGGAHAASLAAALLEQPEVRGVGLGARDSLRLEAGLCLYGNDMDDTTTPSEAGLLWTIGKRRRQEGGFVGAETILGQIKDKSLVTRKRIGFTTKGAPAREGMEIFNQEGDKIGSVTSGVSSPCLKQAIGMAYVEKKYFKSGTELQVQVRKKMQPLTVTKMPFVPANYYRGQ